QYRLLRGARQGNGGRLADLGIRVVDESLAALFLALIQAVPLEQIVVQGTIVLLEHPVNRLREECGLGAMCLVPPGSHRDGDDRDEANDDPLEHGARAYHRAATGRFSGLFGTFSGSALR